MTKVQKKRSKSRHRKLWPFIVFALVIVLIAITTLQLHNAKHVQSANSSSSQPKSSNVNLSPPAAADNNANNARKGSSNPSGTLNSGSAALAATPTFTVQIVSANVSNGNLHIGTLVNGATTGTCVLSASQAGQSTLQLGTSSVKLDVNNYDCGVFNIPTTTFPNTGAWELQLTVTSNGSSNSGNSTVTI